MRAPERAVKYYAFVFETLREGIELPRTRPYKDRSTDTGDDKYDDEKPKYEYAVFHRCSVT